MRPRHRLLGLFAVLTSCSLWLIAFYESSINTRTFIHFHKLKPPDAPVEERLAQVPTFKIKKNSQSNKIPGIENIYAQNLSNASLIRLVDDLKKLYVDLRYGNSSMQGALADQELSDHIAILPKYDPTTYRQAIEVDWPNYDDYDLANSKSLKNLEPLGAFSQVMERPTYEKLMRMTAIFTYLLGKHQIEFMIGMGTLLGSYRHFDKIPWDDDVDFLINIDQKDKLFKLISTQDEFKDLSIVEYMSYFKLSDPKTPRINDAPWGFPFIDIAYYQHNETHFNTLILNAVSRKESIYPLRLRPFGKYWLPAPKRPLEFLAAANRFNVTKDCVRGAWNHRTDKLQKPDSVACQELKDYYPIVEFDRSATVNGQTVQLESIKYKSRNKTVHLLYYDELIPITITVDL